MLHLQILVGVTIMKNLKDLGYPHYAATVDGRTINKYRRLLIKENKEIFDNFKLELLKKMNQILKENGFPTIE